MQLKTWFDKKLQLVTSLYLWWSYVNRAAGCGYDKLISEYDGKHSHNELLAWVNLVIVIFQLDDSLAKLSKQLIRE